MYTLSSEVTSREKIVRFVQHVLMSEMDALHIALCNFIISPALSLIFFLTSD